MLLYSLVGFVVFCTSFRPSRVVDTDLRSFRNFVSLGAVLSVERPSRVGGNLKAYKI